jgi:hypothetical protein
MLLNDIIRINVPLGLMVVCSQCGTHFALDPGVLSLAGVRKVCGCCGGEISSSDNALYKLFSRMSDDGLEFVCAHYRCAKDCAEGLLSDGFMPVDTH